ncbi:MAG: hypothetical protein OXC45_08305, partial [Gemmatimonadetes bacterium]|nr:hypothetical protein [Gemmatimonadota bacterium]
MLNTSDLKRKLEGAFPEDQVATLTEVLLEYQAGLATSVDMQDLKDAVKALTEAQARTETRMVELTEAQARTEKRMEELAVVQTRTEERLGYLTEAQTRTEKTLNKLVLDHDDTRKH